MRNIIGFLMAMVVALSSGNAYASIQSLDNAVQPAVDVQIDQAQEDMQELVNRSHPVFSDIQNGDDLYYAVVKELTELGKIAERLGIDAPGIMILRDEIPEDALLELSAAAKTGKILSVQSIAVYEHSPVGIVISEEDLVNMPENEWNALCELYGFKDKDEFISKSDITQAIFLSLIQ